MRGKTIRRRDDRTRRWRCGWTLIVAAALLVRHVLPQAAPMAVLFIGNSLTAANDLPSMVGDIAHAHGAPIAHETMALPNFSLEDHWQKGDAVRAIARGGWSTIVLQQGPSALPESRVLLRTFTRKFDAEARRAGARTALYMVWPAAERMGDFDSVHQSYASAADDVRGLFLPAGDAWRAAWRRDSTLALYAGDKFHPTRLGSYLAALVIYAQLTGQTPADITRTPRLSFLESPRPSAATAATIGAAVAEAVSAERTQREPLQ